MAKKQIALSQEMVENIKNYGSEIVTIEDNVKAIRQNIGMYIGSRGNKGVINMFREILQNALDELIKEGSPCTHIYVHFDEKTFTITVEDNGRGIPFGNIIRIFQNMHTSSNYTKKKGEYSSGMHGVGAKVTNALSSKFIIESYILGEARRVEFYEGHPWDKGEVVIPNKGNKQGTRIIFTPSYDALGEVDITWKDLYFLTKLILPLAKIGASVTFEADTLKGKHVHEELVNEDGLMTYLIQNCNSPIIKPIYIMHDNGRMKAEVMFTFDMDTNNVSDTTASFCNCCPTSSGEHIDGFLKGVSDYFVKYMNKIYLANSRSKVTITPTDVKSNLKAIISSFHIDPVFNGQAKEILNVPEMLPFMANIVKHGLDEWAKVNPKDLEKICKYLKEIAEIRTKADTEKVKLNKKYVSSALSGLPSKYVAPTGTKDLELIICEGDSAAGTIKNHRINARQGYFPLRGKIPNAFKTSKQKFLDNAEISGLIAIIGGGFGKNFDITKVKWSKIIIATDADADGDHISALLLKFFMMYMPGLIESGRLYKAQPPLWGVKVGKKMKYFMYRIDYIKYVQGQYTKTHKIDTVKGRALVGKELSKLFYINSDYVYEIERVSNNFAIDPLLLETLVTLRDKTSKQLMAYFKKDKAYQFLKVKDINGGKLIEGSFNWKIQTIYFDDRLLSDCQNIISMMNNNEDLVYLLDKNPVTIYQLMKSFNASEPDVQRYKGLGEMNPDKLFESTLDPDNRALVRYTIEDLDKEMERISYYESNTYELIRNVKMTRFDLIG